MNQDLSSFENSADPDQLASDEVTWSGSTVFYIPVEINEKDINWGGGGGGGVEQTSR